MHPALRPTPARPPDLIALWALGMVAFLSPPEVARWAVLLLVLVLVSGPLVSLTLAAVEAWHTLRWQVRRLRAWWRR